MHILYANPHETFAYAAKEMKKYLDKVAGQYDYATVRRVDALPAEPGEGEILLGLCRELGRDEQDVCDPTLDDLVDIDIRNGKGFIAGSNPRSVLFGVYDFFKSFGCLWVRPGPAGEYIVHTDPATRTCVSRKLADVRFRGECLEGSPNYEHLRATVVWAPKVHMNLFMLEQIVPYNYMSRWYRHECSTFLPDEDIGYEGCAELMECLEQDIRRTGLQFHRLGHGYQVEPYGIHFETSYQPYTMNPRMERALALVGGKRAFYGGSPFWSQLCMSNDEVLREQVAWLADFTEKKPYVDFLHVWLGDAVNNHCECENCRAHHPSDLYLKMLNMLDAELTRRGIDTRIVMIAYTDTLWAPEHEKLNNPARFLLCTAIGARDYGAPIDDAETDAPIPKWERNHFHIEGGFPMHRKMFRAWQKVFDGPNFVYDYRFYTEHYNDPGSMASAAHTYIDARQAPSLGFGGIMSDQTQRCAFPNGFPVMLIGEAQYDFQRSFDEMTAAYYKAAYGKYWARVLDYLKEITLRFDPDSLRRSSSIDMNTEGVDSADRPHYFKNNPAAAERLAAIADFVDQNLPFFQENTGDPDPCHARSYQILVYHAEYCKLLAGVYEKIARGDMQAARAAYRVMKDRISEIEPAIQYEFEIALFDQFMTGKLKDN